MHRARLYCLQLQLKEQCNKRQSLERNRVESLSCRGSFYAKSLISSQITSDQLVAAVDAYKYTLTVYGHEQLPATTAEAVGDGEFQERPDSLLLLLARSCPGLNALVSCPALPRALIAPLHSLLTALYRRWCGSASQRPRSC